MSSALKSPMRSVRRFSSVKSWTRPEFKEPGSHLKLALGKDIAGDPICADLVKMPHLLIAGTTGSGKSVGVNAMILSLLFRHPPEECRLIMIDPKILELSIYEGIPHLLTPVVTEPRKAVAALKWRCERWTGVIAPWGICRCGILPVIIIVSVRPMRRVRCRFVASRQASIPRRVDGL